MLETYAGGLPVGHFGCFFLSSSLFFALSGHFPQDSVKQGHRGFAFVTFLEEEVAAFVAKRTHTIKGKQVTRGALLSFCNLCGIPKGLRGQPTERW